MSEGTKRYDGARAEEEMLKFLARFIEDRVSGCSFFIFLIFKKKLFFYEFIEDKVSGWLKFVMLMLINELGYHQIMIMGLTQFDDAG